MISRKIDLSEDIDISEFKKIICFISEAINKVVVENRTVELFVQDDVDIESIAEEVLRISVKYKTNKIKTEYLYRNDDAKNYEQNVLENQELFHLFRPGFVGLKEKAIFLYDFFEKKFREIAKKEGAIEKKYPVLLPIEAYKKTGYLQNSPQYAMFCCSAKENLLLLEKLNTIVDMDEISDYVNTPQLALSPSACFHTYMEYEGECIESNKIVTFTQSVFRNEGRLNYNEVGRLQDYHVREIVFLGDAEYVKAKRMSVLNSAIEFMKELNLTGYVSAASDPFILPKMQKYKKIQMLEQTKYEIKLNYGQHDTMSCASFNLHGTAFTYPFSIRVRGLDETVTGCVGFGLERWVLAFLCQYGDDIAKWPDVVKSEYQ